MCLFVRKSGFRFVDVSVVAVRVIIHQEEKKSTKVTQVKKDNTFGKAKIVISCTVHKSL